MNAASYETMDEALAMLADRGPDLQNGMTSHAPMVAEALCALGRGDAVIGWVERYRTGMLPWPATSERIDAARWREALGRMDRVSDWRAFFTNELAEAPWTEVVERWTARLAPGICAAATHGVIRVGHAVRSLEQSHTPLRLQELADAFASWAATYEELPTAPGPYTAGVRPRAAIERIAVVPPEKRIFAGSITSSLTALPAFPPFAAAIGEVDVAGDAAAVAHEMSDVFARVYLANVHDVLTSIVFVHGVTSIAAVGHLLPHLEAETAQTALRYAWQSSCALYATFGSRPAPARIEAIEVDEAALVDRAVEHGDEHAIKLTEACLAHHRGAPSAAYLAAAVDAIERLPRA